MSALEQEILERIAQLDDATKLRLLEWLDEYALDEHDADLQENDSLKTALLRAEEARNSGGDRNFPTAAQILDEIREERLNDLMGNR